jgi:arylsulfatase
MLKDPKATIRGVVFAEHNWHVYRNHERMVRFGDYLYIRNNFPNQPNLCYESDDYYPAGAELWKVHAAGKTKPQQHQLFANPCPPEELFMVSKDPHQLSNLINEAEHQEALEQARSLLSEWTEQTGDTIPGSPTPNRHEPPRIVEGEIIPAGKALDKNPHAEMPGASRNASGINHPGPIEI